MSYFYSSLLLVASYLENLATCGTFLRSGGAGIWRGPSIFIIVFFFCSVLCLCRRLVDTALNIGGKSSE